MNYDQYFLRECGRDEDETLITNFDKSQRILYEAYLIYAKKYSKDLYIKDEAYDSDGQLLECSNSLRTDSRGDLTNFWKKAEKIETLSTAELIKIIKKG